MSDRVLFRRHNWGKVKKAEPPLPGSMMDHCPLCAMNGKPGIFFAYNYIRTLGRLYTVMTCDTCGCDKNVVSSPLPTPRKRVDSDLLG
jgi:hypothetical protein